MGSVRHNTVLDNTDPKQIVALNQPMYIKVHRTYLEPDTLDAYDLPWEWDDVSLLSRPPEVLPKPIHRPLGLICLTNGDLYTA